jgi:uncharacterized repeat protein (TIGR01451 family)
MDEVRRVTTTRAPKKITTILIVIVGILGLILIGVAIYFYSIRDTEDGDTAKTKTCGCYYIDPSVISECTDPRRGFMFETITVPEDQTCKAACSTSKLSTNLLKSTTKQELFQICQLQTIQDTRCTEMVVKDKDGKIVTGKISTTDEITIEAKFDKAYTDYSFTINNEAVEPDVVSPDNLTIKKTLSNFDSSSLNIVATGKDSNLEQINSPVCRRLIEVEKEGASNVNEMQIQTKTENKTFKLSNITIKAGNLKDDSKITLLFSFNKSFANITMKDGFTLDASKGEITILQQDLYKSENFTTDTNFSQLSSYEGELKITVDVKDNNNSIGSTTTSVIFPTKESLEEETPTTNEKSNFTVKNTGNLECVERVSPNNTILFTITTTNNSTTSQVISSIKDKLPLGFSYVPASTKINGTVSNDNDYVKVTDVGETKEIVWSKSGGWSLDAGKSIVIAFQASVGASALTGSNQNEVVVTPTEIPADPSSLRTEYIVSVQQDCDNPSTTPTEPTTPTTPDTGIFDTTIGRIFAGFLILTIGWYIYTKPFGRVVISKLVNSGAYKTAEILSWKIFNPKKYFEEKTISKLRKKS